jgi:hypothetical protein
MSYTVCGMRFAEHEGKRAGTTLGSANGVEIAQRFS